MTWKGKEKENASENFIEDYKFNKFHIEYNIYSLQPHLAADFLPSVS